jgi:N-acetyl sugar amidotransferase
MDTSASDILFDKDGVCSYCTDFLSRSGHLLQEDPAKREKRLDVLIGNVKDRGKGNAYDCVVGVSGGVDSSWALVQAVNLGLRPLAVHMDNGWNSELAQNNIANLVRGLDVDLYTHVIDWEEYRALMQAFFDADVINIELLYDNAMLAVNFQQAARYRVKYILAGTNTTSEGVLMPRSWAWHNFDKKNIMAIAKQFGNVRISSFPAIGTFDRMWFEVVKGCRWVSLLDYIEYNKFEAMDQLSDQYGYKPYPYKHYESIFTRFYQGFILPEKFGVDKRRLHFSSLIISEQMRREDALNDLDQIPYPDKQALEEDKTYFLKKMNWREGQLTGYLSRPRVEHDVYGSERKLYECLSQIYARLMRKQDNVDQ